MGALENVAQATAISRWQDLLRAITRHSSDVCRQNLRRAVILVAFVATSVPVYENP
jgi:hypothetical protein